MKGSEVLLGSSGMRTGDDKKCFNLKPHVAVVGT